MHASVAGGRRPQLPSPVPRPANAKMALGGIVVIDFSRIIAGPYATMLLADLGAEVIKIENPVGGDDGRSLKPPELDGESALFLANNRNKKSIAIDLRSEAGRQVALDLIARGDVMVENFSAGVMDRLGLGYEAVAKINPRIVYCSISAFGRTGAFAERPGYDPLAQAESGFISMNGFPDSEPVRAGSPIVDVSTGMMSCNAILGALVARERNGIGQLVETALFDDAIAMLGHYGLGYLGTGVNPERVGNGSGTAHPCGIYFCSDGPIYLVAANDRNYQRLVVDLLGRTDLAEHPDFRTNNLRVKHGEKLNSLLKEALGQQKRDGLLGKARAVGVPMGLVRTVEEAFNCDEIRERGLLTQIPHPTLGAIPNVAPPFRFHGTPIADPVAAPTLGQHQNEILSGMLGYDETAIAQFTAKGAFGKTPAKKDTP